MFSNRHHIRCDDQVVPKSMLRKEEVVISKNSGLSRRQEYFGDSWKSGAMRNMLECLAPGKHCKVRTFFREWMELLRYKEYRLLEYFYHCIQEKTSTDEDI